MVERNELHKLQHHLLHCPLETAAFSINRVAALPREDTGKLLLRRRPFGTTRYLVRSSPQALISLGA